MKTKEKLLKNEFKNAEKLAEHKYRAQFNNRESYKSFIPLFVKLNDKMIEEDDIDVNVWVLKNMFLSKEYIESMGIDLFGEGKYEHPLIGIFKMYKGLNLIKNDYNYCKLYLDKLMIEKELKFEAYKEINESMGIFKISTSIYEKIQTQIEKIEKVANKLKLEQELTKKNDNKKVYKI